jgi:hypothetical protein
MKMESGFSFVCIIYPLRRPICGVYEKPYLQALNKGSVSLRKNTRLMVSELFGSRLTESALSRVHLLGLANCLNVKTAPGIRTCYIRYIYLNETHLSQGQGLSFTENSTKNSYQQLCFINY